jgi:hypothetical protein
MRASRWVSERIGSYPSRRCDRCYIITGVSDVGLSDVGVKTGLNAHAVSSAYARVTQVLRYNNGVL